MNKKEYLHSIFEFIEPDNDPISESNDKFKYDNVVRYWLSAVFYFFKLKGCLFR